MVIPGHGTPTTTATSSTSTAAHHGGSTAAPPAGTIAGGVVGGAAGLAVILLVALVLLRWYKRRSQQAHQALPPSAAVSPDPDLPPSSSASRQPGMAERAGMMPFVTAVPGFFRHQSRGVQETGERGFTRVSGRKLPSAFSEGMSSEGVSGSAVRSPPPAMPLRGDSDQSRNLSSQSFYRDSAGYYGGEGASRERPAAPLDDPSPIGGSGSSEEAGEMVLSPGPQRRPTIHTGGPYAITPSSTAPNTPGGQVPTSPTGTAATMPSYYARDESPSLYSADNRSSRFTEEV